MGPKMGATIMAKKTKTSAVKPSDVAVDAGVAAVNQPTPSQLAKMAINGLKNGGASSFWTIGANGLANGPNALKWAKFGHKWHPMIDLLQPIVDCNICCEPANPSKSTYQLVVGGVAIAIGKMTTIGAACSLANNVAIGAGGAGPLVDGTTLLEHFPMDWASLTYPTNVAKSNDEQMITPNNDK